VVIALRQMIDLIVSAPASRGEQAYTLCSLAADLARDPGGQRQQGHSCDAEKRYLAQT